MTFTSPSGCGVGGGGKSRRQTKAERVRCPLCHPAISGATSSSAAPNGPASKVPASKDPASKGPASKCPASKGPGISGHPQPQAHPLPSACATAAVHVRAETCPHRDRYRNGLGPSSGLRGALTVTMNRLSVSGGSPGRVLNNGRIVTVARSSWATCQSSQRKQECPRVISLATRSTGLAAHAAGLARESIRSRENSMEVLR